MLESWGGSWNLAPSSGITLIFVHSHPSPCPRRSQIFLLEPVPGRAGPSATSEAKRSKVPSACPRTQNTTGLFSIFHKRPRPEKHKHLFTLLEKGQQYHHFPFLLHVLASTQNRQRNSLLPDIGLQKWRKTKCLLLGQWCLPRNL